jgi:hypothetical protein
VFHKFLRTKTACYFNSINCMAYTSLKFIQQTSQMQLRNATKFCHKAAHRTQNSAQMLDFFRLLHAPNRPLPISVRCKSFTSQCSILPPTNLYQKNEWAPPGKLQSCNFFTVINMVQNMLGRRRRCSHFFAFFSTSKVDVMDVNTLTFLGIFIQDPFQF